MHTTENVVWLPLGLRTTLKYSSSSLQPCHLFLFLYCPHALLDAFCSSIFGHVHSKWLNGYFPPSLTLGVLVFKNGDGFINLLQQHLVVEVTLRLGIQQETSRSIFILKETIHLKSDTIMDCPRDFFLSVYHSRKMPGQHWNRMSTPYERLALGIGEWKNHILWLHDSNSARYALLSFTTSSHYGIIP